MFRKIVLGLILLLGIGALLFYIWPQPKYEAGQPSDAFLKNAESFYVAPLPPDWTHKDFITDDGRRIRWGETGNRGAAKATLVFVPGFGGVFEMYGEQIDQLAERGFHVVGFEARGMGGGDRDNPKQPEQMNPSDFKTYSDDFAKFYTQHVTDIDHDKAVFGLSFGAHLSMRAIGEHDLNVQAFIGSAPALRLLTGAEVSYEDAMKGLSLMRKLGRGEYFVPGAQKNWLPYSDDLTLAKPCGSYPERLYRRDVVFKDRLDLRTGGPTVNWVLELDESGSGYMTSDAFKAGYDVPTKFMLADKDTIVDSAYVEGVCNQMDSCQVEYLTNTGHCLWVERDEVLNRLYDVVDELLEN